MEGNQRGNRVKEARKEGRRGKEKKKVRWIKKREEEGER